MSEEVLISMLYITKIMVKSHRFGMLAVFGSIFL